MPGGIKISKPERLPKENVSDTDLQAWWNELLNYLDQDDDFHLFKANNWYQTWTACEVLEDRIPTINTNDDSTKLQVRRRQLNNYLTIIAGCCARDHYMMVIKQATSLQWIWNELQIIYQHTHKGKDFLSIVDIEWDPTKESAVTVYTAYRAKILENLKPAGTHIEWKNTTIATQETLSPTFEDHILLTVLNLIDRRLPSKVKDVYGPRIEKGKVLMDFKMDILTNVNRMLADIDDSDEVVNINASKPTEDTTYTAAYMRHQGYNQRRGRGGRGRYRGQSNRPSSGQNQFCRLCHLSSQPRSITTSHEIGDITCPSLSSRDKEGLQAKLSINAIQTDGYDEYDEEYEQTMMMQLAENRGYSTGEKIIIKDNVNSTIKDTSIHVIKPVPSQILTVFQNDLPIHLDLDSGCWINSVRLDYALKMKWKIHPNGQLAKIADGKTVLKSKGEIHETFQRNNWKVKFSAIVLTDLHTTTIAGNNFLLDNTVKQDISNKTIIIHNKYVVPETNRNTELPTLPINAIMPLTKPSIHLPNQNLTIKVPHKNDTVVLVEPAPGTNTGWPAPQLCTVHNNTVQVVNPTKDPIVVKKTKHIS